MGGFFPSNTIDVGELFGCFFGTHRKAGAQSADERLPGGGGGDSKGGVVVGVVWGEVTWKAGAGLPSDMTLSN